MGPGRHESRRRVRVAASLAGAGLAVAFLWPALGAQAPAASPPILIDSLVGGDLFAAYCAPCHGTTGRGDGPVADVLTIPPADLSTLARRNGGMYPAALVQGRLTGMVGPNDSLAHGSTAMPIWGPIFQQLDQQDVVARIRVQNLVAYVETLQAR